MAKEFIVYSKTKAEFEALVSSGEVDNSQMGIIAETGEMWWNGEYRPIAETVPFANDLTGRIEATPEEFTFRPSAGDKSIRDESALIKRIKGNTIVWNQLVNVSNPVRIDFLENTDMYYQILGRLNKGIRIIKGHKYIGTGYVETNIETRISFGISSSMQEGQIITSFGTGYYKRIFDASTDKDSDTLYVNNYSGQKGFLQGDYISCTLNLFDLTKMFGAGNEPTTVEEFKALFPNNYYDYNAGELVSMTSNGLFANGFNQWDEEWVLGDIIDGEFTSGTRICPKNFIEIIPNQVYSTNNSLLISLYDSEKNFIPYDGNGDFPAYGNRLDFDHAVLKEGKFPYGVAYIKFVPYSTYNSTTYKNNICINLSHTGVRNGEYEPYWDATKDLSIIQKYFPNGMRSAGSIYDEISFDEATQKWVAIQRVGSVDLGSLGWSEYISGVYWATVVGIKEVYLGSMANIVLASKLNPVTLDGLLNGTKPDNSISVHNTLPRLYAKATSYTDATSFKSAMSGVMLYYELAEPIITPIEEPIDLSYKVGDFGIEKMLSDSFSAPFKADIIYQFNATDRVRENSMHISKLSKKHNLLKNEVDTLESKALTTEEQSFSNDQKAQVAENLGGNTNNGLVRYVGGVLPLKKISAPDDNGVEQTYVLPNASDEDKGSANGVIATEGFVDEGYIPRPSGTSASKNNKLLAYSNGRTYDSGVGISQDVSDITNSATDSVPTSAQVKEYVDGQHPTEGDGISIIGKSISVKSTNAFSFKDGQLDLSASTINSIQKGEDAKTAVDALSAVVSPTISGGARVLDITVASGLIDDEALVYALPSAPTESLDAADAVLATEGYVAEYMNDNLPTTVATAIERVLTRPATNSLRANTIYDISQSTTTRLTIVSFVGGSGTTYAFDDVWRVRFAGVSSALTVVPTVRWENGIAPNFSEWAICDLEFRRLPNDEYIGKWKIYR